MTTHWIAFTTCLALAACPLAAVSQASAPEAITETPVRPAGKPGPRLLTPTEKRDSASPPGDLRPERRVTPQISVPLGRTPPPPGATDARSGRRAAPGSAGGGIDDAATRCESLRGEQVRAKCRDQQARAGRTR